MTTRRAFLQLTLVAGLVPVATAVAGSPGLTGVLVLVEGGCPDSDAFAARVGSVALGPDPTAALLHAAHDLVHSDARAVIGLTRNAAAFLAQELLRGCGFRSSYQGRHGYRRNGLEHVLRGAPAVVTDLEARFTVQPDRWPEALAELGVDALRVADAPMQRQLHVRHASPPGSPGDLVSWVLVRDS
jgi:hypothetical protein